MPAKKKTETGEKKPVPKKTRAVRKPRTAKKPASSPRKPRKPPTPKPKIAITNEDIARRAYYIAEDRARHGKPGDEDGDWHEAERQLKAEAADKSRKK